MKTVGGKYPMLLVVMILVCYRPALGDDQPSAITEKYSTSAGAGIKEQQSSAAGAGSVGQQGIAADTSSEGQQNAPADMNVSTVSGGTNGGGERMEPLKGSVQIVELDLEKLRDVGLDLKEVLKAASSLYDEVTVQPVRIITQPQRVGFGTIINIPVATQPIGPPRPARKERVDLAINAMSPILNRLRKNVDEFLAGKKELNLPDNVTEKLQPQFKAWIDTIKTVSAQQDQLDQITQRPPYDNKAIADLVVEMQKEIKELDKTRLAIYKVIRKEGKRRAGAVQDRS